MEKIISIAEKLGKIRNVPQFLFIESVDFKSSISVRNEIKEFIKTNAGIKEIDFVVNSPGGSASDAYRIIRSLRSNFEIVNIIIPFWAKSAATLLSLGGSSIIMDEFGEFGPLDVQIAKEREDGPDLERESALNDEYSLKRIENRSQELFTSMFIDFYENEKIPINKLELSNQIMTYLSDFYKPLLSQINPLKLGDKKRKLEIGEKYADRILSTYNPTLAIKNKKYLIDYLVNRCPDHGYVIDFNIISAFLPGIVKRSAEFGTEYKDALSELSEVFFEEIESFIKIIDVKKESAVTQLVEDTLQIKEEAKAKVKKNSKN